MARPEHGGPGHLRRARDADQVVRRQVPREPVGGVRHEEIDVVMAHHDRLAGRTHQPARVAVAQRVGVVDANELVVVLREARLDRAGDRREFLRVDAADHERERARRRALARRGERQGGAGMRAVRGGEVDERLHRVERVRIGARDFREHAGRAIHVARIAQRLRERRRMRSERHRLGGCAPPGVERLGRVAGGVPRVAGVERARCAAAQRFRGFVTPCGVGGIAQPRGGLASELVRLRRARLGRDPVARGVARVRVAPLVPRGETAVPRGHACASHAAAASTSA
jgi:hypothetical protein